MKRPRLLMPVLMLAASVGARGAAPAFPASTAAPAQTQPAVASGPTSQPAAPAGAASRPSEAVSRPAGTSASSRPAAAVPELRGLAVYPSTVQLDHKADDQRIVLVGTYSNGETRDLTSRGQCAMPAEPLAAYAAGQLRPLRNGEAAITFTVEGRTASAKLLVRNIERERPISFRNDVIPVFMKAGCSTGACHGSAQGKNGFRLSLFGFEPEKDYISLTREYEGRRIDLADPHRSLLLRKPLASVEHGGGERLKPDGELTAILTRWVAANVPDDPKDLPTLTGIELLPAECVLRGPGRTQQFVVLARYSDGTDRDVTSLAVLDAPDKTTAPIDAAGVVTSGLKGEAFIMARFGTFAVVSQIIVLPDGEPFTWQDQGGPEPNFIDEAINAKLKKLQINPSPISSDETFLRRVTLDTVGLPPSVEEYRVFMADTSADKRARLIDTLLARREFPEVWAMKWADLLRIESDSRRISFKAMYRYNTWLRDQILGNRPLDQMVRDLLTANGGSFANPPTNFYIIEPSPTLMAENVAQVFCGIRVQCAQCHNHPFERWTQDDYYSFAAFFPQVGRKPADDPREQIVYNAGSGEVRHLQTGAQMAPQFLGGAKPEIPPGRDRRAVLAEWLTSKENPYFAACFVDRVWEHFMGRGIVNPPDDVRVSNPPSHPELRAALARRFVESGYDMRALVRWICNSRAYQRSSRTIASNEKDARNFSHAMVRRLGAETLLDAVCQVTGVPEKFRGLPLGARAAQVSDARAGSYFLEVFGRPPRISVCTCERQNNPTLSQALHLINGPTLSTKIAHKDGRLARLLHEKAAPEAILEDLYLAAYSRLPRADEKASLLAAVAAAGESRQALEDIYWAVLNSKEFVFNH